ncbi:MAG: hypothetical protein AB7O24_24225 [Kofleriaceae bacterium]
MMVLQFTRVVWVCIAAAVLTTGCTSLDDDPDPVGTHTSELGAAAWPVFEWRSLPSMMSTNRVANPGFETGATGWASYGSGYTIDSAVGHASAASVRLDNNTTSTTDSFGASQTVTFSQQTPRPILLRAWSKAQDVTGSQDSNYALYADVVFADGTLRYNQSLTFNVGTHDWYYRERVLWVDRKVSHVKIYALLRGQHTGTVWFDDISVSELDITDQHLLVDSQAAALTGATAPAAGAPINLTTGDGLSISLGSTNGVVTGLSASGVQLLDTTRTASSGVLVRDVRAHSDWWNVGGAVTATTNGATHTGAVPALELAVTTKYTRSSDRITINIEVTDTDTTTDPTSDETRAVTVYYSLPLGVGPWTWGDDVRRSRNTAAALDIEYQNLTSDVGIGATGAFSRYPWSAVWTSGSSGRGVALGYPISSPRIARFTFNPRTRQYMVGFDLGLSPETTQFPRRASVELVLYRVDSANGFRDATQGYQTRFGSAFIRRIPPAQQGIWAAFSDVSPARTNPAPIAHVEDFGIGAHETGNMDLVDDDDGVEIPTFRYVSEPWSHWLPIKDAAVNRNNYSQVMSYLNQKYTSGNATERKQAEATLSSGAYDFSQKMQYEAYAPGEVPWCPGDIYGCVLFYLNADPAVTNATYPLNRANQIWRPEVRGQYTTTPTLDGEYLDSFLSHGNTLNERSRHFRTTEIPLTFGSTGYRRAGLPLWFTSVQFARWLAADVRYNLGKLMMANMVARELPFGADIFDYLGTEISWTASGSFVPDTDDVLIYSRTLAGTRPYGLLLNGDFGLMGTNDNVKRYFQIATFYGMWPSFFYSFGDPVGARYFENADWYDRDRPIFKTYIPIIRQLATGGWRPITNAQTDNANVYIERYGLNPTNYFTLRNMTSAEVTVTVTLGPQINGTKYIPLVESKPEAMISPAHTLSVTIPAGAVEVVKVY